MTTIINGSSPTLTFSDGTTQATAGLVAGGTIATGTITNGTVTTLTTTTISDGTNSTSSTNAIQGSAKAWVNFNGQGTVAIRGSYNVSSITDNGTGDYTINFTNALPNANYCAVSSCGATPALSNFGVTAGGPFNSAPTTSAYRIFTGTPTSLFDPLFVFTAIFD